MTTAARATPTTPPQGETQPPKAQHNGRADFMVAVLNMSWQLAIVVLVPLIGGVQLDKKLGTSYVCTFVGLGVALVGSGMVMWRTMQAANRLPVPKLTAEQKRTIQKQYEEDDD